MKGVKLRRIPDKIRAPDAADMQSPALNRQIPVKVKNELYYMIAIQPFTHPTIYPPPVATHLPAAGITITFAAFFSRILMIKWLILSLGILFEVLGTISMKYAEGFTKLWPSVLVFLFYGISLAVLVFVLEKMEVSIAYAIWASAGTALIAVIGIVFFKEHFSVLRAVSIALIIIGIIGLELSDK